MQLTMGCWLLSLSHLFTCCSLLTFVQCSQRYKNRPNSIQWSQRYKKSPKRRGLTTRVRRTVSPHARCSPSSEDGSKRHRPRSDFFSASLVVDLPRRRRRPRQRCPAREQGAREGGAAGHNGGASERRRPRSAGFLRLPRRRSPPSAPTPSSATSHARWG